MKWHLGLANFCEGLLCLPVGILGIIFGTRYFCEYHDDWKRFFFFFSLLFVYIFHVGYSC